MGAVYLSIIQPVDTWKTHIPSPGSLAVNSSYLLLAWHTPATPAARHPQDWTIWELNQITYRHRGSLDLSALSDAPGYLELLP